MPEAAVDEHDLPPLREHEIGRPWQIASMEAEPIAQAVRHPADDHFRFRAARFDTRHERAAVRGNNGLAV